jgi:glycosyltransferase involved in cell wall biosynthesis
MIGIVIPTYRRPDGKTKDFLIRALESIEVQTYKDYQVFVIGDDYSDLEEFQEIAGMFPNVWFFNLSHSVEREKYSIGDYRLYCAGGLGAVLSGINKALEMGVKYICHLDHDDWWEADHLEEINKVIEKYDPLFICTLSTYKDSWFPFVDLTSEVQEFYPVPMGLVHSATCVKHSDTKLLPRDVFAETGVASPGDADLWERLAKEMHETGRKGYLITKITCHHDTEGYSWHGV